MSILSLLFIQVVTLFSLTSAGSIYDDAPYQTLQFTPNITHRTNLCERQQLLRLGDIGFLDVLRGMELSVGLPDIPGLNGWVNYDEKAGTFAEYPGYHIELLDELAYRAGFSWRNSYGVINPYLDSDFKPNATTNELLVWTVNAYDFSFSGWDHSIERMQLGVDFPMGFADSSTILITRNSAADDNDFNFFSFLQPFDWTVWVSILVTIIFTGLVYRWVSKTYSIGQSTMQPRDENVHGKVPGVNIFYAALTATGHMEFSPVTYGERILVLSLCFWSLVIAATYTANLASVMISKNQSIYPATSISEAQYRGISVCVTKGLAVATKLKEAYPNANIVEIEGFTSMYDHLLANKCGLVADTVSRFEVSKLNGTLNPDCALEWVGRAVDISSSGPANIVDAGVYCTSLVGHIFEYYLKDMQHDGFLENAFERYVSSVTTHTCPEEAETSPDADESFKLTMVDMGGIFICHGIACVLGLLVSFMQRYWGKRTIYRGSRMHGSERIGVSDIQKEDEVVDRGNGIMTARQIGSGGY